mmetsp:Transcript_24354/g.76109  ORF Transcript_24354/g.76109 Transcript_24354/m.76109 type:complete len:292 (-) Transcript_24354:40-915(-)
MMLSNPPAFIDFSLDNEIFQVPEKDLDGLERLCFGDWFQGRQEVTFYDKVCSPTTPVKQSEHFLSKSLPQLVAELEVDEIDGCLEVFPSLPTLTNTKKRSLSPKAKKQETKVPAKKKLKTQKSVEKKTKQSSLSKSTSIKQQKNTRTLSETSSKTKKNKNNQGTTLNKTKQKIKTKTKPRPKVQRLQTPKAQIVTLKTAQTTVTPKGKAHRSKWADKDILTLWQGIYKHGSEWRVIRELFPGRTYDQIKDKGRRLLQQKRWKSGRTKALSDDASRGAKQIAEAVLQTLEKA